MPRWLQILLAIFAMGVITVLVLGYVGYRWMERNRGRLQTELRKVVADGEAYGRGKDVTACMDESLRIYDRKGGGLSSRLTTQAWMESCAKTSTASAAFCATVPRSSEVFKGAAWANAECARREHANDQGCSSLMLVALRACERKTN